jgi:hypothetical protein
MKTFKQFNEGLKDKMKPKSNDEILKTLEKLPDNEKIEKIIRYQLDYNLLLRNEEGICIYNGDFYCINNQLTSLPEKLVVKGDLYCSFNNLNSLPDNLVVKGHLWCKNNELPKDIKKPKGVKGELIL